MQSQPDTCKLDAEALAGVWPTGSRTGWMCMQPPITPTWLSKGLAAHQGLQQPELGTHARQQIARPFKYMCALQWKGGCPLEREST